MSIFFSSTDLLYHAFAFPSPDIGTAPLHWAILIECLKAIRSENGRACQKPCSLQSSGVTAGFAAGVRSPSFSRQR
jgi:hypothetical protein